MSLAFAPETRGEGLCWPADPRLCTWNGLWGGALLGLATATLEQASGQPLRALSAQFLAPVRQDEVVGVRPELRAAGRQVTQAGLEAFVAGRPVLSATAVMGLQPTDLTVAATCPSAPDPQACEPVVGRHPIPGGLHDWLQMRLVDRDEGGAALWIRWAGGEGDPLSAAVIASSADAPSAAVVAATEGRQFGITLDTSLRLLDAGADLAGDAWLLVDTRFEVRASNLIFAQARVWGGGRLLALCGQTLRLRSFDP